MNGDKINTIKITAAKVKKIIKSIEYKTKLLSKEASPIKQLELIDLISNERNKYLTLYWASYIGYLKNIKDEKYLKSENIISKYDGSYNNAVYKLFAAIDDIKQKEHLVAAYGQRFISLVHNQKQLLSNNEYLFTEEATLKKEYRKVLNNIKVNFNSEEISLIRLNKFLTSDNENERKLAHDKRYNALLEVSEGLSTIFQELLKVRNKIAKSSNFKSYKDYCYAKMNRLDYTQADLRIFKDSVIKYFVPLREKLKEKQKIRLGEEKLSYYNESYLFKDGNAKTKLSLSCIVNELQNIFTDISPEYGKLFKLMVNNKLIDLDERENKSAGGITTFLPDLKVPIFIKRYINNSQNFISITHEFGHSLQLYLNKDKLLHENRWPTFDICEIHSTTMELLVSDYTERIYEADKRKHLITHYTNLIEILIRTSAIDDFNSIVYNENIKDSKEINEIWKSIYKKYYPTNNYELDYFKEGIWWQADINRIDNPFYGIDYALATIYALSFYQKYLDNKEKGIEVFTSFCKDGGEISFKEISRKYKLLSPFEEQDLIKLSKFIEENLNKLL